MEAKKLDKLIEFLKDEQLGYYCECCGRLIMPEEGVYVHDEVYHPEDWSPDGGQHRIQ